MKSIMLLVVIVISFLSFDANAQLRPAQAQYLKEKGVLINPSFEQGFKGWIITGCTKTLVSDIPLLNKSLKLTCVNETFSIKQETTLLAPLEGQQAAYSLQIKATANGVKVSGLEDTQRSSTIDVISSITYKKIDSIGVTANSTSNGVEIYADSNFTGELVIDDVELGLKNLTQEIGQAHFVGSYLVAKNNCVNSRLSTTYGGLDPDPDCVDGISVGNVSAPDIGIPAVKIPNARVDGYYRVSFQGLLYENSPSGYCTFQLSSTSTEDGQGVSYVANPDTRADNNLTGDFRFQTTGNKQIQVIVASPSGVTECQSYGSPAYPRKFSVYFYPDEKSVIAQQTSVSPDKAGFITWGAFDADIEGHLKADGSCVSRELYPDYFRNVGDLYGSCDAGAGANSGVRLPDLVTDNRFIRMGGGSLTVGQTQTNELKSHSHVQRGRGWGVAGGGTAVTTIESSFTNGVSTLATGGSETRPNSIVMIAYVRMFDRNILYGSFAQVEEVKADLTKDDVNTINIVSTSTAITSTDFGQTSDFSVYPESNYFCLDYSSLGLTVPPSVQVFLDHNSGVSPEGNASFALTPNLTRACVYTVYGGAPTIYTPNRFDWKISKQGADVSKNYKAIVIKESSINKTTCTKVFLNSNVTTNGVISDLTINTLEIGKKYRIASGQAYMNNLASLDSVLFQLQHNGVTISNTWVTSPTTNSIFSTQISSPCFTAASNDITANAASITAPSQIAGDGTTATTFYELCELPETYICND